jgi:uncharacterized protein (TIGR03545 family)/uncharacterized protein (TIGR03546 family)
MLNFIIKLLRALNSSERTWQLTVAILLGFVSGLTPVDSLHNLVILFFVLILNINLGMYLITTAFFSAIAYIIDPIFDMVGFSILTLPALDGIFTTMYNSDFMILTEFNNSILMGSLALSLALVIPFYFVINRVIKLYRDTIANKLNSYKLTKYLYIFGSSDGSKAGIFRWWGVGVFATIGLLIYIINTIFLDYFIRVSMERSLKATLDTDVKIESVDTSLSQGKIDITKLVVYDKEDKSKAIVTVGNTNIDLLYSAMIRKKLFAENISMTDVVINENAPSIKAIDKDDQKAKSTMDSINSGIKKGIDSIELSGSGNYDFANLSVDDILAKENLTTVTEANKIRESIKSLKDKYSKIKDSGLDKGFVDEIKADIDTIKNMKNDALSITKKIAKVAEIEKKIKEKKELISSIKNDFLKEQKAIKESISKLKSAPYDDLDRLKKKYTLDFSGGYNVLDTLIKDDISIYKEYVHLAYEKAKPYFGKSSEDNQNSNVVVREDGRWVLYKETNPLPLVVIKNAKLDISLRDKKFDLNIKDLSSDQNIYKHKMVATLSSTSKDYNSVDARLVSDRVANIETFKIDIDNLKHKLIDAKKLALNDNIIDISANGTIKNLATIDSSIDINFIETKIAVKNSSNSYEKILNDTMSSFDSFNLDIKLSDKLVSPTIDISSDIDKKLNSAISSIVKKQQDKFVAKLEKGLKSKLGDNLKDINSDNNSLLSMGSIFDSNSSQLDGLLKDALGSKGSSLPIDTNKLKGLFGF